MSQDTAVTGPVLDSGENSAPDQEDSKALVKVALTGLTSAEKKLLASLNEESVSKFGSPDEATKVAKLFQALGAVKDAAEVNQTYVGAYAVRKFVGTDANPGPISKGDMARMLGKTASRVTQYMRSAELAFDLHIDPRSDLWSITSNAQNSPEFSAIRKEGLTPEKVAAFWAEEKAIASLAKPDDRKAARAKRRTRLGLDKPAVTATPSTPTESTLSPNGKRLESIVSILAEMTVPDADDCASLLALRDRLSELQGMASESDRKAGAATYGKLRKASK